MRDREAERERKSERRRMCGYVCSIERERAAAFTRDSKQSTNIRHTLHVNQQQRKTKRNSREEEEEEKNV